MAFTQKQLFVASQLFMAAGKSGLRFDLARFIKDSGYANETLISLAGSATEPALQAMVAQAIVELMPQAPAAPPAPPPPAAPPPAAPPVKEPAAPPKTESRYIGRLR
jgi:hypothetical protein